MSLEKLFSFGSAASARYPLANSVPAGEADKDRKKLLDKAKHLQTPPDRYLTKHTLFSLSVYVLPPLPAAAVSRNTRGGGGLGPLNLVVRCRLRRLPKPIQQAARFDLGRARRRGCPIIGRVFGALPLISWNRVKAFRRHGPLRNDPLPLLCATIAVSRSRMCFSRRSPVGAPPPSRSPKTRRGGLRRISPCPMHAGQAAAGPALLISY